MDELKCQACGCLVENCLNILEEHLRIAHNVTDEEMLQDEKGDEVDEMTGILSFYDGLNPDED